MWPGGAEAPQIGKLGANGGILKVSALNNAPNGSSLQKCLVAAKRGPGGCEAGITNEHGSRTTRLSA